MSKIQKEGFKMLYRIFSIMFVVIISVSFCLAMETYYFDPSATSNGDGTTTTTPFNDFKNIIDSIAKYNDVTVQLMSDWNSLDSTSTWTNRISSECHDGDQSFGVIIGSSGKTFKLYGYNGKRKISCVTDDATSDREYSLYLRNFKEIYVKDIEIVRTHTNDTVRDGTAGAGIRCSYIEKGKIESCSFDANGVGLGAAIDLDESRNVHVYNCTANVIANNDTHLHFVYMRNYFTINCGKNIIESCSVSNNGVGAPIDCRNSCDSNVIKDCTFTGSLGGFTKYLFTGWYKSTETHSTYNKITGCTSSISGTESIFSSSDYERAFWEEWFVHDKVAGEDPAYIKTTNSFTNLSRNIKTLYIDLSNAAGFDTSYNASTNVYSITCTDNEPRNAFITVKDTNGNSAPGQHGADTAHIQHWVVENAVANNNYQILGNGETIDFSNDNNTNMRLYNAIAQVAQGTSFSYELTSGHTFYLVPDNNCKFTAKPLYGLSKKSLSTNNKIVKTDYLNDCYPNPFNPTTMISFQLSKQCHAKLQVYDITGRMVETLLDEVKGSGRHTIQWDASNHSSGTYFYRLSTPEFSESKKLMLLK